MAATNFCSLDSGGSTEEFPIFSCSVAVLLICGFVSLATLSTSFFDISSCLFASFSSCLTGGPAPPLLPRKPPPSRFIQPSLAFAFFAPLRCISSSACKGGNLVFLDCPPIQPGCVQRCSFDRGGTTRGLQGPDTGKSCIWFQRVTSSTKDWQFFSPRNMACSSLPGTSVAHEAAEIHKASNLI